MENIIIYLKYIILGLIQGITEILPVSSSGHLVIFQTLLNVKEPGLTFEMFTNMASLIAMIILFYKDIWKLIKATWFFLFYKERRDEFKCDFLYVVKLIIALIPIGIFGFIFRKQMGDIKNLLTVGISLMITGTLLLLIYFTRNISEEHEEVTFKDATFMGITQIGAIFPGVSRSGSTIIGGRINRLSLPSVLKFSFLLYILISIPTSALSLYEVIKLSESINWIGYSLSFLITLAATYFTARLVMKRLKVEHLIYFGIYCVIIGLAVFTIFFI